jgi:O-antigen ligase
MDNYSAFFLYPMLSMVLYEKCLHRGGFGISGWLLLFAVVGIYLLTRSLTAAGAGVLMLPFLLIRHSWNKLPAIRGIRWVILAMAVILVLICGFQVQNLLASLLDSMSKGVTLNSRTYLWEYALRLIRERPLLGHGSFTEQQLYTDYVLYGTSHAHNLLLELLLRAGIVGSAGFLVFLFGFAPFGKKQKVPGAHGVLIIGLVGQLVLFFMDHYPTIQVFYIFMGVLYCSPQFVNPPLPEKTIPREDLL